ncbi:MAG TPA: hypothetical protein VF447_09480, partial [Terriglobales bacterium]
MSMSKKLYLNFGIILAMVAVLFFVTLFAVKREQNAKDAAGQAMQMTTATDKVRFQVMQNRLFLSNYLLSGDSREVEHMNEGVQQLRDELQTCSKLATSERQRSAITDAQKNEEAWGTEF